MDKHQCRVKVYSGGFRVSFPCQRPVTVERDGKYYCWQHDPEYVKAKEDKRMVEWQQQINAKTNQQMEMTRRYNLYQELVAALEAVEADVHPAFDDFAVTAETFHKVEEALARAKNQKD